MKESHSTPTVQAGKETRCSKCYGFGMFLGTKQPMGPLAAADGIKSEPCPACKANVNPYKKEKK